MHARPIPTLCFALLLVASGAQAAPPAPKPKPEPAAAASAVPAGADAPAPTPATAERNMAESKKASGSSVVKTEEGKEGVKTYQFGAVEVEGRLRSPQLIYFLRRVRAEFVAGELGHRSFMRELESTRRNAAFR